MEMKEGGGRGRNSSPPGPIFKKKGGWPVQKSKEVREVRAHGREEYKGRGKEGNLSLGDLLILTKLKEVKGRFEAERPLFIT